MKKSLIKPLLSLLFIAAIIAISLVPAFAATFIEDGNWRYEVTVNGSEYYIEEYLSNSVRVSIPALFQNRKVTKINSEAFLNNKTIQYVEFPATVNSIGNNAFYGCTALKSVTIPATITSIGNNAFYGCNSLIYVSFEHNSNLKSIPIHCFNNCLSLSTAVIAQGVERIEGYAFSGCSSLSTVIISPSVTYIADTAFLGCKKLVINGWEGTYAQQFAMDKGITFVSNGTYVEPTAPDFVEPTTVVTEPVTTLPEAPTTLPIEPTTLPTQAPTELPTNPVTSAPVITEPTEIPTLPTEPPTERPTEAPTSDPTEPPTQAPTVAPTELPTTAPTTAPTQVPTVEPTSVPVVPTDAPTLPTVEPTTIPVAPTTAPQPTQPLKTYLIGDCDTDGRVSIKDATMIQKHCAELIVLDHISKFLGNCDGVGDINIKDATQIQKYCASLPGVLFVGTEVQI